MGRFLSLVLCLVASFTGQSVAHFLLNYPPTIGFDDSLEATPPCGSFAVNFSKDNVTDFHVGGDFLAMTSIHPQATWLFRATLDQTAMGNWTDLLPAIVQVGLGNYCEQDVMVPSSFAGFKGVVQVVQDAPDGILYQCAAVNFVSGSATPPTVCTNVTGLSANYTTDPALSSLPAGPAATSSAVSSTSTSASTSTSTSTSSSTPSDATTINSYSGLSSVMWLVMIATGTFIASLV